MQRKRQISGTLRPFKPAFSSECDFRFKVGVKISAIKAKWINVIDRWIYIVPLRRCNLIQFIKVCPCLNSLFS